YAACVLPVCQKPELGLQLGFDRFRLSKIRYDRLRPGVYAAIVRLRLSTRTGRNTMAIDAGGIEIAVALAAACRTPVAKLAIGAGPSGAGKPAASTPADWPTDPCRLRAKTGLMHCSEILSLTASL